MQHFFSALILLVFATIVSCNNTDTKHTTAALPVNKKQLALRAVDTSSFKPGAEWNKYWYANKAEITSYQLKQSRYGELHDGSVVNIFVTEDFSKTKQVKLDEPEDAGSDRVKVLKLNQSFKFITGIYPYSMMLSTFSPIDVYQYPHAIKITASAQEWCGQSFFQLNNSGEQFLLEQRSYFEKENDQDLSLPTVLLEDELWNLLRIDPLQLPTGNRMILPGALYFRLSHKPLKPVTAVLSLQQLDTAMVYAVNYPDLDRKLEITLEKNFPYQILGWTDTYPSPGGKLLTTTATRNKTILIDYWTRNGNVDRQTREQLSLQPGMQ